MKKNKKDILLKITISSIAPILSIIAFIVMYYLDPLQFAEHNQLSSVPALLFSIVILLIGHSIDSSIENGKLNEIHAVTYEKISDKYGEIYEALKTYLHVIKIGSTEVAFNYVLNNSDSLKLVKNTSFTVISEQNIAHERFYSTDSYERGILKISEFSCGGKRWKDIGDKRAITRFKRIKDGNEKLENSNYSFKLLLNNTPQINFMILTYEDDRKEVLFNWDYRAMGYEPTVLLSRDETIINMFNIHFESLWRTASDYHDNERTAIKSIPRK